MTKKGSVMETSQDYSLSGKVFRTLSEQILSGKYQTGDELREVTVGKELGVSRTPVREAFRKLELEGLVTSIPNKGTYVNGISRDDVQDIYMIRSRLEGLAARLATRRITPEQINEMEEMIFYQSFILKGDDRTALQSGRQISFYFVRGLRQQDAEKCADGFSPLCADGKADVCQGGKQGGKINSGALADLGGNSGSG